jgi:hypothetical protein
LPGTYTHIHYVFPIVVTAVKYARYTFPGHNHNGQNTNENETALLKVPHHNLSLPSPLFPYSLLTFHFLISPA